MKVLCDSVWKRGIFCNCLVQGACDCVLHV